jgi:hypothetical protein
MSEENVLVQIDAAIQIDAATLPAKVFHATVEVDGDPLNTEVMPDKLTGIFEPFQGVSAEIATMEIHTPRSNDGTSHKMWFHSNRHGYFFSMEKPGSSRFLARTMRFDRK